MSNKYRLLSATLSTSFVVFVSACTTVGPNYVSPEVEQTELPLQLPSFSSEAGLIAREPTERWWQTLQDPVLPALVAEALVANHDLAIASANLKAARALLREERTTRWPDIQANSSVERSRNSGQLSGLDERLPINTNTSIDLGLAWEIDVVGRIDRLVESATANLQSLEAIYDDTMRIVAADVALAYIDLREAQLRLDVASRNLENQIETVRIAQALVDVGSSSRIDVVRAMAQRATTEAALPSLVAARVAALNRLSTLMGKLPGSLSAVLLDTGALPVLPDFIAIDTPATLLRRRPDIRAAERALAASTARIGVQQADLFPRVTFGASVGIAANQPGDLDSSAASLFGLGPSLTWNLFDRNGIHARIQQAKAATDAQLAVYQRTVLSALEETDTALSAFVQERVRLKRLQIAVAHSQEARKLAQTQYNAGTEAFISVLDAERVLLSAEDAEVRSMALRNRSLIAVYRAVAGGW